VSDPSSDPCSTIMILNIQGMDPSAHSTSRHKLTNLKEEHVNSCVPIISLSETWLKPHITNAQINIPNYQIVRQDRLTRTRGGVLLYVHNHLPTSNIETFEDGTCEAVICSVKSINTIIASVYRPPNTPSHSFNNMLSFLQKSILRNNINSHSDLIITGDFNLPKFNLG
jgi:exonuclease III